MVDGTQQTAKPAGDPIGPGLFPTLRQVWMTKTGRRTIVLTVTLIVVAVIIVVALIAYSSASRESQSYRDGYSVGGAAYAADTYAQADAQQACKKEELLGPEQGGIPTGDDPTQWLRGCVGAFATAQSGN